jgi:hypothetical protein
MLVLRIDEYDDDDDVSHMTQSYTVLLGNFYDQLGD